MKLGQLKLRKGMLKIHSLISICPRTRAVNISESVFAKENKESVEMLANQNLRMKYYGCKGQSNWIPKNGEWEI